MAGPFDLTQVVGTGTISQSYTVTVQEPNSILILGSYGYIDESGLAFTYDGLALTQAALYDHTSINYLLNPPVGAHTLASEAFEDVYALFVMVFTECRIANPVGTSADAADVSLNVTAGVNSVVLDVIKANTNILVDPSQTQIGTTVRVLHDSAYVGMSYESTMAGGTVNMLWSGGYQQFQHTGVALNLEALPSVVWW